MFGTMMDRPLLVSSLLHRAERVFGDRVNVSCEAGCRPPRVHPSIATSGRRPDAWPPRHQFGRPIASFQLVQLRLAEMLSEITSMQL